jgi:hypothetical protein
MLDLKSLDTQAPAESGTDVELEHPATGDPLKNDDGSKWIITVRGIDSKAVKDVQKKQQNRFSERLRKRGQFGDAESNEKEQVERLVAATIGWKGLIMDGAQYEFSRENAEKLYGDPRFPWIVEQVNAAMVDRKRFFSKG